MCRGYVRMLAGLTVQGLLKSPGGGGSAAALPQFNSLAQVLPSASHPLTARRLLTLMSQRGGHRQSRRNDATGLQLPSTYLQR
jgi:hypothetical protein